MTKIFFFLFFNILLYIRCGHFYHENSHSSMVISFLYYSYLTKNKIYAASSEWPLMCYAVTLVIQPPEKWNNSFLYIAHNFTQFGCITFSTHFFFFPSPDHNINWSQASFAAGASNTTISKNTNQMFITIVDALNLLHKPCD